MKNKNIIIHELMHDKTMYYYKALIEMQASTQIYLDESNTDSHESSKNNKKSKAKCLTKCYIRGRLNK